MVSFCPAIDLQRPGTVSLFRVGSLSSVSFATQGMRPACALTWCRSEDDWCCLACQAAKSGYCRRTMPSRGVLPILRAS